MPSVEVIVAPVRFISGQKLETENLPVDRAAAAEHERAEHRGDERVEVEQRQRRPHHVVGGRVPSRCRSGAASASW